MQDKTEWKLNGQVLNFTVPLTDQVCTCWLFTPPTQSPHFCFSKCMSYLSMCNAMSPQVSVIKVKIHEATGMPAGKQKLQYEVNVNFNPFFFTLTFLSLCQLADWVILCISDPFRAFLSRIPTPWPITTWAMVQSFTWHWRREVDERSEPCNKSEKILFLDILDSVVSCSPVLYILLNVVTQCYLNLMCTSWLAWLHTIDSALICLWWQNKFVTCKKIQHLMMSIHLNKVIQKKQSVSDTLYV